MPGADTDPLSGLPLAEYRPNSLLRLPQSTVPRASAPAVDGHTHLGRWLAGERWAVPDVAAFVDPAEPAHLRDLLPVHGNGGRVLSLFCG